MGDYSGETDVVFLLISSLKFDKTRFFFSDLDLLLKILIDFSILAINVLVYGDFTSGVLTLSFKLLAIDILLLFLLLDKGFWGNNFSDDTS